MVIAAAIAGAIGLAVVTLAYHWIFFRSAQRDGQYALVLLPSLGVGAVLGSLSWTLVLLTLQHRSSLAGWLGVLAGAGLGALCLWLGWSVFAGTESPTVSDRLGSVLFWFLLPLLWCAALVVTGLVLLA